VVFHDCALVTRSTGRDPRQWRVQKPAPRVSKALPSPNRVLPGAQPLRSGHTPSSVSCHDPRLLRLFRHPTLPEASRCPPPPSEITELGTQRWVEEGTGRGPHLLLLAVVAVVVRAPTVAVVDKTDGRRENLKGAPQRTSHPCNANANPAHLHAVEACTAPSQASTRYPRCAIWPIHQLVPIHERGPCSPSRKTRGRSSGHQTGQCRRGCNP